MANRAYKFRIYPNDEQKTLFAKTFGCVRMVYNYWLDRKIRQYEENKTNVTYTVCAKEMAAMKKMDEYAFLKEIDSVSLQQSLRHLDMAFQNFFKQPKAGFPRFKSKKRNKNSYSTVCINGNITIGNGYLKLPKVGQVRLKQHRVIPISIPDSRRFSGRKGLKSCFKINACWIREVSAVCAYGLHRSAIHVIVQPVHGFA